MSTEKYWLSIMEGVEKIKSDVSYEKLKDYLIDYNTLDVIYREMFWEYEDKEKLMFLAKPERHLYPSTDLKYNESTISNSVYKYYEVNKILYDKIAHFPLNFLSYTYSKNIINNLKHYQKFDERVEVGLQYVNAFFNNYKKGEIFSKNLKQEQISFAYLVRDDVPKLTPEELVVRTTKYKKSIISYLLLCEELHTILVQGRQQSSQDVINNLKKYYNTHYNQKCNILIMLISRGFFGDMTGNNNDMKKYLIRYLNSTILKCTTTIPYPYLLNIYKAIDNTLDISSFVSYKFKQFVSDFKAKNLNIKEWAYANYAFKPDNPGYEEAERDFMSIAPKGWNAKMTPERIEELKNIRKREIESVVKEYKSRRAKENQKVKTIKQPKEKYLGQIESDKKAKEHRAKIERRRQGIKGKRGRPPKNKRHPSVRRNPLGTTLNRFGRSFPIILSTFSDFEEITKECIYDFAMNLLAYEFEKYIIKTEEMDDIFIDLFENNARLSSFITNRYSKMCKTDLTLLMTDFLNTCNALKEQYNITIDAMLSFYSVQILFRGVFNYRLLDIYHTMSGGVEIYLEFLKRNQQGVKQEDVENLNKLLTLEHPLDKFIAKGNIDIVETLKLKSNTYFDLTRSIEIGNIERGQPQAQFGTTSLQKQAFNKNVYLVSKTVDGKFKGYPILKNGFGKERVYTKEKIESLPFKKQVKINSSHAELYPKFTKKETPLKPLNLRFKPS